MVSWRKAVTAKTKARLRTGWLEMTDQTVVALRHRTATVMFSHEAPHKSTIVLFFAVLIRMTGLHPDRGCTEPPRDKAPG
jgi:hypothetical protein